MLIITSKKPGFRRCGMAHPAAPIEHPDGTFTPEEIEILKAEPMLVVLEADEEQAELTNTPVAARKMIELVKKAESLDELEALAAGESRKSVLEAIETRRQELEA